MQNLILLILIFLPLTFYSQCGQDICEDFNYYNTRENFVHQVGDRYGPNSCWYLWNSSNTFPSDGSPYDATVENLNSNPTNRWISFYDDGSPYVQNVIRDLGNVTSGDYDVSFVMSIGNKKRAFVNILNQFVADNRTDNETYSFKLIFLYDRRIRIIHQSGPNHVTDRIIGSYPQNVWFPIYIKFDLDNPDGPKFHLFINGDCLYEGDFGFTSGGGFSDKLSGIQFKGDDLANFCIDDLCIENKSLTNQCRPLTYSETIDFDEDYVEIEVESSGSWCLDVSQYDWIHELSGSASGTGSQTVRLRVDINNSNTVRNAYLQLCCGSTDCNDSNCDITHVFNVSQLGWRNNATCAFSPSKLSIGAMTGSTVTTSMNSSTSWQIIPSTLDGWLNITPNSGNGSLGTVIIEAIQENNGPKRTDTIDFSCDGQFTFSLIVTQDRKSNNSDYLIFNPSTLTVPKEGGQFTVEVSSNSVWVTNDTLHSWISSNRYQSGTQNDIIQFSVDSNMSTTSRQIQLTYDYGGASGGSATLNIYQEPCINIGGPSPWDSQIVVTTKRHIVNFNRHLQSDIKGNPISIGDWIGFFYLRNGNEVCGGAGQWMGQDLPIVTYGNEQTMSSGLKDGFDEGEEFIIKVRKASIGATTDIKALADYYSINTGAPPYTHTNRFEDGGYSGVYFIYTDDCLELPILNTGNWRLISSYVEPLVDDVKSVFADNRTDVAMVLNDTGHVYIPQIGYDEIGKWNSLEGYQVRVQNSTIIQDVFCGNLIVPETVTLSIDTGWQLIPYLRASPKDLLDELGKYSNDIEVVKDERNYIWYPPLSVNYNPIGKLKPLKAYWIKARNPFALTYSPNFNGNNTTRDEFDNEERHEHFENRLFTTGNGANLIVSNELLDEVMAIGDEIGIYSSQGELCGSSKYNGNHMYISVIGDDIYSDGIKEGLNSGEKFILKLWDKSNGNIYDLDIIFRDNKSMTYQTNEVYEVKSIQRLKIDSEIHISPNPTGGKFRIIGLNGPSRIVVYNLSGSIVTTSKFDKETANIDLTDLPNGVYTIDITSTKTKSVHKVIKN